MAPVILTYISMIFLGLFLHNIRHPAHRSQANNKLTWISFFLGLLLIIGLIFSNNIVYGFQKSLFFFIINIPLFLIPYFLTNPIERFYNLLIAAFSAGIVLAIISFTSPNAYTIMPTRFSPTESVNPIFLARSLGISALCGVCVFASTNRRLIKVIIILAILFMIPPMVWTLSRGPLLGFFLIVLIYYFIQPRVQLWRKLAAMGIGLAVGAFFIIRFASGIAERLTVETVAGEGSTLFRILSWLQAIQDFAGAPLTGIGTGSFFLETPWIPILYPHNLVLEFASENGILGLILIILFLIYTIQLGIKNLKYFHNIVDNKNVQLSIGLLCLFLFALWNAMFSGDVFKNEIVWLSSGMITSIYFGVVGQERTVKPIES